ncbi:GH23472 [Drosophila grimshawi]|uniref:GH23472 n=1 Tax=Drosophila grimshawi TaxID=7222 RepID=B4K0B1_DROGR|nr:GH23472 [Drosophila grimshawi]
MQTSKAGISSVSAATLQMYSHLLGRLFIVENDKRLNNYFNSLVQEIRKMSLVTVYRQQVVSRQ